MRSRLKDAYGKLNVTLKQIADKICYSKANTNAREVMGCCIKWSK